MEDREMDWLKMLHDAQSELKKVHPDLEFCRNCSGELKADGSCPDCQATGKNVIDIRSKKN